MSEKVTTENSKTSSESINTTIDTNLIQWEEFALSLEEHFHAQEMYKRNPNGKALGHR